MTTPENESRPESGPEKELEKLKEELKEYKDKYLRQLAETENMRKRLQKEKQESTHYAIGNVMAEFLAPIDHMENALRFTQGMSEEVKHWGLGFQMILTQFKDVLNMNGVKQVDDLGKPFDPHVHEAIEMIETVEHPPGVIVEVCVPGYQMGEKTIRPSRVKVSKKPENNKEGVSP